MIFVSCKESRRQVHSTQGAYFDLIKIVQNDINNNRKHQCGEEKTVYITGNKETKKIDAIDWEKELQPLLECDINKAAWKDKFYIDTIVSNLAKDTTIQYRALTEKISVRSLSIMYSYNKIQKIIITKKINSLLFSIVQIIEYWPGMGFSIRGEQKALMMNAFDLNVDVKYLCKN